MDVNHNLNSLLNSVPDGFSGIPSKIRSSSPIQLGAKWQFYKNTHFPSFPANSISYFAKSPYPYPKDLSIKLALKLSLSASNCTSARGSAPGDKMKIIGVQ